MKTNFIFLIAVLFIAASCNDECERGHGRSTTQTYNLAEFDKIDVSSWGDVEIIKSSEHKIEVHAQPNIIDKFRINVSNSQLSVGAQCFNSNEKPKLFIYCDNLRSVRLTGAGNIRSDSEFVSENLDVELTGSGNITLKGIADDLYIKVSGSGDIHLSEVLARTCEVKISGVSDCEINVKEHLTVKISGSGKVYYKGEPTIDQKISGVGKVVRR